VFSAHASLSQQEEPLSSVSVVLRHRCVPSAEGLLPPCHLVFILVFIWSLFSSWLRLVVQMRFMLFMKKSSALLALLRRSLQEPRLVLAH
ncbi:unnamed protein product, partial [Brassica oleracea]